MVLVNVEVGALARCSNCNGLFEMRVTPDEFPYDSRDYCHTLPHALSFAFGLATSHNCAQMVRSETTISINARWEYWIGHYGPNGEFVTNNNWFSHNLVERRVGVARGEFRELDELLTKFIREGEDRW